MSEFLARNPLFDEDEGVSLRKAEDSKSTECHLPSPSSVAPNSVLDSVNLSEKCYSDEGRNLTCLWGLRKILYNEAIDLSKPVNLTGSRIEPSSYFVLKEFDGRKYLAKPSSSLQPGREYWLRSLDCFVLQNSRYGDTFTENKNIWRRTQRVLGVNLELCHVEGDDNIPEVLADNRDIQDRNDAQKLTALDIHATLANDSAEGVIKRLIKNSATFFHRTKYAKAKYILKKTRKHLRQVTILKAVLREVCEVYFQSYRNKILGLRHDYLSAILNTAMLFPKTQVLVLDHASGLLTAGVSQRLCGEGRIIRLNEGGGSSDQIINECNISSAERAIIYNANVYHLLDCLSKKCELPTISIWNEHPGWESPSNTMTIQHRERQMIRQLSYARSIFRCLERIGLSAFVAAVSPYRVRGDASGNPDASFEKLLGASLLLAHKFLRPGGRLVLFSQSFEPLANIQAAICSSNAFVHARLEELMLREFQVLPGRTHPLMNAQVFIPSGFILSAICVKGK